MIGVLPPTVVQEKLTAYFKKNFNRPPPRKKVERPAAMQKVEPNQQPSRGDGVKKEEPGYWGGTGMRVKGEQEDIKPQIGAGSQAGGWGQHLQQPQHQHQQHPTNSTFDAIAAADAARFAKMQSGPPARAEQPPPPSTGAGSWVQGGAWDSGPVGGSSGWDQGQRHSNPPQQQPGQMMGWGPGAGQPAPPPAGANQPPPPGAGWGNLQQPQQGGGGGWGTQ